MIPSGHRSWQLGLARWLAIGGAIAFFVSLQDCALAQIQADGTVGTTVNSSTFLPCNTSCTIEGGTQTGNNLFHSFGSFSIPNGGIADFLINNSALANILARVTGGSPSDIQGLIRGGGNANLFLINPNGIIFGPNAQLDIGGSFVATTANAIAFSGDGEFSQTSAVDSQNPLLSVNPSAFLFNQIADFTASSELGLDGTLEINTRDKQLEELPAEFANVEISQVCQTSGRPDQSEFIVTGRGGLPPNPGEALNGDAVQVDLATLNPKVENRSSPNVSTNSTRPTLAPIVEAQGWIMGANDKVVLTANAPTVTPHRSWQRPPECSVN